jgi:hypothetical protein
VKMRRRYFPLPPPRKCKECGEVTTWELAQGANGIHAQELAMHSCQCSKSDYQKTLRACAASPGGHDVETVAAGQHSFDRCRKCGHHV